MRLQTNLDFDPSYSYWDNFWTNWARNLRLVPNEASVKKLLKALIVFSLKNMKKGYSQRNKFVILFHLHGWWLFTFLTSISYTTKTSGHKPQNALEQNCHKLSIRWKKNCQNWSIGLPILSNPLPTFRS